MKVNKNIIVVSGLAALVAATYFGFGAANQTNTADAKQNTKISLESDKAKLGYSFGARIGQDLARGGIMEEIEIDAFLTAIRDFATGSDPRMTTEEIQQAQQTFQLKQQQEYASLAAQNQSLGDAYLVANKSKDGVEITESGLQYEVIREGKGKQPQAENTVKLHYAGKLTDDTTFDSSYDRNEPASFAVANVIPGFSEGLQLMKEGAKYRFVIPASLAYGQQGPASIGPNQVLVFEVELLEVL